MEIRRARRETAQDGSHTALALIVQNHDWDWQTSEKEYRRAIELNANYATAHHWYAEHLMWLGRFDEALGESERALQLDPLSLIIATDHGAILYFSRQYDRAIEQLRTVLRKDPNFARAGALLISAYVEKGCSHKRWPNPRNCAAFTGRPWILDGAGLHLWPGRPVGAGPAQDGKIGKTEPA